MYSNVYNSIIYYTVIRVRVLMYLFFKGTTMENLRRRVDARLITEEKSLKKMITKPQFHAFRIFHDKLSAVNLKKTHLILNRPLYVGLAVLELSKLLMHRFH